MFRHEGPARSIRKNAILAGYLALVAGFVNSGGFVFIGSFTSHVTGNIGRFSLDLAEGRNQAALLALLLVAAFFAGAFIASLIVESNMFRLTSRAYAIALLLEAIFLALFISFAGLSQTTHPRTLDAEAAILCLAMGMQNSLVTRLSGAVIRTTHLTGIVTDLGIEAARWYRWYRAKLLEQLDPLLSGRSPPLRPTISRVALLIIIVGGFALGSVLGALAVVHLSRWAMLVPAGAIFLASVYAFWERDGGRTPVPN